MGGDLQDTSEREVNETFQWACIVLLFALMCGIGYFVYTMIGYIERKAEEQAKTDQGIENEIKEALVSLATIKSSTSDISSRNDLNALKAEFDLRGKILEDLQVKLQQIYDGFPNKTIEYTIPEDKLHELVTEEIKSSDDRFRAIIDTEILRHEARLKSALSYQVDQRCEAIVRRETAKAGARPSSNLPILDKKPVPTGEPEEPASPDVPDSGDALAP